VHSFSIFSRSFAYFDEVFATPRALLTIILAWAPGDWKLPTQTPSSRKCHQDFAVVDNANPSGAWKPSRFAFEYSLDVERGMENSLYNQIIAPNCIEDYVFANGKGAQTTLNIVASAAGFGV
jgi:hypothetical protein